MKFMPKVAGKVQGHTCKTVEDYALRKLQKDLEWGEEKATNLRKVINTGINTKEPAREMAEKNPMTKEQREDTW